MSEEERDFKRIYRQPLNYENVVLLSKIRDISLWRDTNIKAYESGVITLALLLPDELRTNILDVWKHDTIYEDLSMPGKQEFDILFISILKLLEDKNICFPKISFVDGVL